MLQDSRMTSPGSQGQIGARGWEVGLVVSDPTLGESGDNFLKRQEYGGGDRNYMKQANRDHWLCSEIHCKDKTHTVFLISDPTMMTLLHSQLLLYMQSMMSDKKQTHAQTHGVD